MNQLLFVFLTIFLTNTVIAQNFRNDTYYTNIKSCNEGFIATDNYGSKLYLIKNNQIKILFESPGCGQFFEISPDGKFVGFKYIDKNRKQSPALINIGTNELKTLHQPVSLCGQVSFSNQNQQAFTIADTLIVLGNNKTTKIPLTHYANLAPISPDGKYVVFNNKKDQLILKLLSDESETIISTDKENGYVYPRWSPNSKKIVYSTMTGYLLVYDLTTKATYKIGKGENPNWDSTSQKLVFTRRTVADFRHTNSDIYTVNYTGKSLKNKTNTSDIIEQDAVFLQNGQLLINNLSKRQIELKTIESEKKLKSQNIILDYSTSIHIRHYKNLHKNRSAKDEATAYIEHVPYVHQVYDTPDFHEGKGSCAPTTSIMAIAFYNRLPEWPTKITKFKDDSTYTRNYGSYIADKYHFNEFFYDTYTAPYSTKSWGGYSYMWATASPSSTMRGYIENHKITAKQSWTKYCTYEKTKEEIDNGYPHPICSWITSSGHLTLAIGYIDPQHTIIFNDPYGDKNTPGYPSYDGKNAHYDWPGYNNGYQNLDPTGTHGGVAWTVTAQSSQPEYNDTIIDDVFYGHGFYIYNQPPSHMQWFRDNNGGYNDHFWWTKSMKSSEACWVSWSPKLTDEDDYDIYAYIPTNYAEAENARYHIFFSGRDTIVKLDQANFNDEWAFLGSYHINPADTIYIKLGDYTGTSGQYMAFDAIKWQKTKKSDFQAIVNKINTNDTIKYTHSYGNDKIVEWIFEGGTPEKSTENNPQVIYKESGIYTTKLIVKNGTKNDTITKNDYIVVSYHTGIEPDADIFSKNISLYPNPCNDFLTVEFPRKITEKITVNIYNMTGILLQKSKQNIENQVININTQTLPNASMYILQIQFKDKLLTRKFLKK